MTPLAHIETALPGLQVSAPEPLPFAPSLEIRAFLLQRNEGNLLIYGAPTVSADAAGIDAIGGISRQYLNHRHEASFVDPSVDAPLFVHENERAAVAARQPVAGSFTGPARLDLDFRLLPTPGHTPGATAYLWDSGEHRFLFTGDTIYLSGGEWVAAVLASSERGPYLESLELIRELDFDVLVPWAATAGQPFHAMTDRADTRRRVDKIIERVRRGEDH